MRSLAFVSGATAVLNGAVLTVTDGAYHASFTLSGSAAAAYVVMGDGAGGALVHAAAGSPIHTLVQAAAAFGAEQGVGSQVSLQNASSSTHAMIVRDGAAHR